MISLICSAFLVFFFLFLFLFPFNLELESRKKDDEWSGEMTALRLQFHLLAPPFFLYIFFPPMKIKNGKCDIDSNVSGRRFLHDTILTKIESAILTWASIISSNQIVILIKSFDLPLHQRPCCVHAPTCHDRNGSGERWSFVVAKI